MKKRRMLAAFLSMLVLLLTGCGTHAGPDIIVETAIVVDKNGTVTYHLVEEFDKEYYDIAELSSMAAEEAAEYNGTKASGEQAVTVERVERLPENESKVTIRYQFDGTDSFSGFTDTVLYYGTVAGAIGGDISFRSNVKNVKDGTVLTPAELVQDGEKKMIITDARAVIYCPAKVSCLSDGSTLREDGSVDTTESEGTVYIILK